MTVDARAGVIAEPTAPAPPWPAQPRGVPWPTERWAEAEPDGADNAVDRARLDRLLDAAFPDPDDAPFGMSLATVVVQRGTLVAERYGSSSGPDEPLISWSMAKSVTHALVGVLVAAGRIGLEQRVVPEWQDDDDPRGSITLDHLLRMVPGTVFNEDYVDEEASHCIDMLFGSGNADMAAFTAALPAVAPPDTVFNYSSGTTNLITRAMASIVGGGDAFVRWAGKVLFEPIGMHSAHLTFDGSGTWVGSSFLHATARDFAKFGLLYLRDGVWDGERILPAGWADTARTTRAHDDEGNAYASHWWVWEDGVFAAQGYETQRILVDPKADVVIVRLGKTPAEHAEAVDEWLCDLLACFPPVQSGCS